MTLLFVSSVGSGQDNVFVLGEAHMRSTPSVRSFPSVAFKNCDVDLTDDGSLSLSFSLTHTLSLPLPFKKDPRALPLSAPLSSRRSMVIITSIALCPQVVSQAPQHFRNAIKPLVKTPLLGHFP